MRRLVLLLVLPLFACGGEETDEPPPPAEPVFEVAVEGASAALERGLALYVPEVLPKLDVLGTLTYAVDGARYQLRFEVPSAVGTGSFPLERTYTFQPGAPRAVLIALDEEDAARFTLPPVEGQLEIVAVPGAAGEALEVRLGRTVFRDLCGREITIASARIAAPVIPQTEVRAPDDLLGPDSIPTEVRRRSFLELPIDEVGLLAAPGDFAVVALLEGLVSISVDALCPGLETWELNVAVDPDQAPGSFERLFEVVNGEPSLIGPLVYLQQTRGTEDTEDDVIWLLGDGPATLHVNEGLRGRIELTLDEPSDAYYFQGPAEHPFPRRLRVGAGAVRIEAIPSID